MGNGCFFVTVGERGAAFGHMQGPDHLGIEIARIVRKQLRKGPFGGCGIPDAEQEVGPAGTSGAAQERGVAFFSLQCRRAPGGLGVRLDGARTRLRVQGVVGWILLGLRDTHGDLGI